MFLSSGLQALMAEVLLKKQLGEKLERHPAKGETIAY